MHQEAFVRIYDELLIGIVFSVCIIKHTWSYDRIHKVMPKTFILPDM